MLLKIVSRLKIIIAAKAALCLSQTMLKFIPLFLVFFASAQGRQFKNPVVAGTPTPDPGTVFYKGVYYTVTTSNNDQGEKFPIRISTDLQNFTIAGYVLQENSLPVWSTLVEFWAPEIHVLSDNQFICYFTTREKESKRLAIGAAYASNILGPYRALDRPLVLDLTQDILDATLVRDGTDLNLIWKGGTWMYLQKLQPDGLGLEPSAETFEILKNDLPWESYIVEGPWVIQKDGYFYMFYSGNEYCGDKYSVGAARTKNLSGPWEKKGDPILVSNSAVKGPGHCSVVKDVNQIDYVMVYHGYVAGEVCNEFPRVMWVSSVAWDSDGWPYMVDLPTKTYL